MTVVSEADASEWDTEDVTLAPVLEAVEPNVRVQEGDDAILKLTFSSGSGLPLNIHWTRGGGESLDGERFVADSGGGVLRIRGARRSDSGPYRARALVAGGGGGDGCPHVDYELDVYPAEGDVPAFLRRLTDLAVKVGTRTRLLVEIRSASQVKTAWLRQGKEVIPNERLHFLNEGSFFCLDVAPVTLEDSGEWAVVAQNIEGRSTCSCFLNVLVPKAYKKPFFVEELRAVLTSGGTVSLECKVIGVPTPQLKWFKDGDEIKAGDVFALSADPDDPTTLGTYTCEASNCMGKALSSSRVHVVPSGKQPDQKSLIPSGPVPKFKDNLKDQKVKIGGSLLLESKVDVPPWPKDISWFNPQGLVQEGGRYHIMADGLGGYSIAVNPVEAADQGQWKCVATSNLGLKSIAACNVAMSFPKNYRAPRFLEALRAVLTEEGLVSFECKVVGFPTPQLQWFKDGQELKPGDVYQLTGSNSLGSYCCIARNCMGEARSTAELTVEDIQNQLTEEEKIQLAAINQPPQFQVGLKSCQAEINQAFRFTVQVTVNPEPVVTWFRDDEELQGSENYSFLKEAHGFCHLSIQRLELIDQAEWKCVATNDYGQSVTSCFLKLNIPRHFKKPRFLECLRAVLSEEGAVNLECKVIGVPQPILKWYKDGKELCPGDIHKIISGEDGTCCLGVYTCEAHNCMGTVSSSASLLGFEQKPQEKSTEQAAPALALTRQPSLSTIQEERSSQMQSITIDDRQEVSFSFDGKEVSVSLYETPDLTEEEALQVVEMYAEELSEHVSEHNVIELPPMRFVKETSTSGHILMEAVVIDVSPDFYASAEDDLRTDADLEEFSISEEAYLQNANLSMQEDLPFDKINSEFLERALLATIPYDDVEKRTSPAKPKRKSRDSSSASESKKKHVEDDSSSPYSDALASEKDSKSQKDSFVSAIESPDRDVNIIKGFESELAKSSSIGIEKTSETKKTLDDPASIQERKKKQSKSRSVSKERDGEEKVTTLKRSLSKDRSDKELAKERSSDESSKSDSKRVKKMQKHSRRKSKSVDSEAEDDSLQEFERRKVLESNLKMEVESDQMTSPETQKRDVKVKSTDSEREDDSLIEFETRKSISLKEQLTEKRKNRDHSLKRGVKKRGSTDSSGREDDSLVEYEKRKNLPVGADDKSAGSSKPTRAKKGSTTKKGSSESSGKEDEAQKGDTEKKRKKKSSKQLPTTVHAKELTPETGVEVVQSSETDSVGRAIEMRRGREIASDVDSIKTSRDGDDETAEFDTAEDSAYDRSEMSVLESLTHSLQEMQRGLAMVGEQIKSSSSEEPESAKSSLSVLESLAQPISDIKKGIRTVEKQIINDSQTGDYSPSRAGITILETLAQPVQELQRTLALVEQKSNLEGVEESILEKTSQSIMETVAQPLQEFNRDIAIIQQQAVMDSTDSFETIQSFKPQLIEVQGGVLQSEKDLSSQVEELSEITMDTQSTYAQSVQELQKGLAQIVERHVYDSDKKPDDDLLPLTVKEIQEDLFENENFIRELKEFEIRIMKDSEVYFDRMDNYIQSINSKIAKAEEEELKDLLNSVCQMISPLNNLQSITSKCIENVAENPSCLQWDVRVSKENIMHSLTRPFEVLDGTINILGKVAECESVRETRKICIASLYKLSVPMDELKTTVKLVENLSPQTAIEFLLPPVENMLSAISGVNSELIRPEFVDNIVIDGGNVLKGLDDSLDIMINCINSIEKYSLEMFSSHKEENIISLSTLTKPLEDLQNNLHSLEKYIVDETQNESMNPSQLYHLVQELGKPLQNIRIELSIIKHQIELEEYSSFTLQPSAIIRDGSTLMFQLLEPIENMQKNVTCFNESVLSKPPDEPSHLRYVLYALSTLTQPMNVLCSTIMKTEEQLLQEIPSVSEPSLGLRIVTQSVSELRQSIESIKNQSHEILLQPELLIVSDILSTLSSPLLEVEEGLSSLSDQVYDEDKTALNINLLKTMAEPFKGLQKALIEISNELSNENISEAVVFELKQPVQELQRSILVIQDQVSFEYGDEPTTIESNIVTLQSLIQPMKTLKRHFINVQKVIAEQNKSVDTQLAQKVIDISKVMHKLQLKISSLMVQQSYFRVSKHSGRLELFPILQHMVQFISDFEKAQQLTVQYIERKQRLDVIKLKEKILNNMQYLKMDMINLHKKLYTLQDLSPSDSSSTEILTKAIHEFTNALMDECTMLAEESLDDGMAVACLDEYFESFVEHINVLHSKLLNIETLSSDMDDKEKMKQRITFQDQSPKKVKILELSLNALQGKLFSMMNVVEHNLQNESAGLSVQIIENMMSCTNAMKENITSLKMETKLTDLKEADEICNRAVEELRDCMALLTSEMNNVSDMFSESSVRSLSATVENITACQVDISKKLEDIILSLEEKEKAPQIDDYTDEIPRKDEIMGSINIVNENIKQKLVKISEADSSHRKIILSEPVQSLTAQLSDLSTNIFSSDIKNEMLTEGQVQENIEIMAGISSSLLKLEEDVKREESINRDTKEQIISSVKNLQKAVTSITEDVKENQTISAFDQIIEPLNDFNETIVGHDDMKPKLSPLRAVMGEEFNEAETLKETSFRILEEFAKASSELEFGLMKVEHNLLNISEMKKGNIVTFVEPLVQPIQKLCEKISLVEEILSDPTVEEHMSSLSMLKTLAEPIRDIQHNIVEIQEHCIESAGKQESGEKVLQVIAKPIRELRTGVALIQEQAMVMEADSISISESLSSSETLAKPLEELKKVLSSIVNQQTLVYEPGTELMSEDRGLSELETIAKPVRELQKQLAAIETQQLLEGSAVDISVKEAIATVAKPVTELRYALATIENQIALESTDSISSDKYAIIKTLEKSLYEVSRGIACINEQQVLEDVVTDSTLSDIPTMASPVESPLLRGLEINEPTVLDSSSLLLNDEIEKSTIIRSLQETVDLSATVDQQVIQESAELTPEGIDNLHAKKLLVDGTKTSIVSQQPAELESEAPLPQLKLVRETAESKTVLVEQGVATKTENQIFESFTDTSRKEVANEEYAALEESSFREIATVEEQISLSQVDSFEVSQSVADRNATVIQSGIEVAVKEQQKSLLPLESLESLKSTTEAQQLVSCLEVAEQNDQPFVQEDVETLSEIDSLSSSTVAIERDSSMKLGAGLVKVTETKVETCIDMGVKNDLKIDDKAKEVLEKQKVESEVEDVTSKKLLESKGDDKLLNKEEIFECGEKTMAGTRSETTIPITGKPDELKVVEHTENEREVEKTKLDPFVEGEIESAKSKLDEVRKIFSMDKTSDEKEIVEMKDETQEKEIQETISKEVLKKEELIVSGGDQEKISEKEKKPGDGQTHNISQEQTRTDKDVDDKKQSHKPDGKEDEIGKIAENKVIEVEAKCEEIEKVEDEMKTEIGRKKKDEIQIERKKTVRFETENIVDKTEVKIEEDEELPDDDDENKKENEAEGQLSMDIEKITSHKEEKTEKQSEFKDKTKLVDEGKTEEHQIGFDRDTTGDEEKQVDETAKRTERLENEAKRKDEKEEKCEVENKEEVGKVEMETEVEKRKVEKLKNKIGDEASKDKEENTEENKKKAEEAKMGTGEGKGNSEKQREKLGDEGEKDAQGKRQEFEDEGKTKLEDENKRHKAEAEKKCEEENLKPEVEERKKAKEEGQKFEQLKVEAKMTVDAEQKKLEDEVENEGGVVSRKLEEKEELQKEQIKDVTDKRKLEVEHKINDKEENKKLEKNTNDLEDVAQRKTGVEQELKVENKNKGKQDAEELKKKLADEEKKQAEDGKQKLSEEENKKQADVLKKEEDEERKPEDEKRKAEDGKRNAEEHKKELEDEEQLKAEVEKKTLEGESKRKADVLKEGEDVKRNAEEPKEKLADDAQKKAEAEKKKLEEGNKRKAEEQKKKLGYEEQKKAETEKKKAEEENQKKKDGLKKTEDEKKETEEHKKNEDEAKMKAVAEKKKLEDQKKKLEDKAKVKEETEEKKLEEEKKIAGELKKVEDEKKEVEEQKKKLENEAEAEKKKLEEEQKSKLEDVAKVEKETEKKKQEEEIEKKAEEQKKRLEDEAKIKAEAEKKKQEEENEKKAEEQKKILEDEAKKRAEAEKLKLEKENKKAEELKKVEDEEKKAKEQKKKLEHEAKVKEEAEENKQEEEIKHKAEEHKKRLQDEALNKAEADKKKLEEGNTRKAEELKKVEEQKKKLEDEAKMKEEAEKKKQEEETKKKAEEQKKKLEDEAKIEAEAEKKKQEEETKKKAEEQKKIIEVEAKKKAEAEKKKLEEETKKKAEEQKKKLEDEAKMKAEAEKKKQEEETKKKAEEQKKIIEVEAKKKAEAEKKKQEEETKKKAEEQKKKLEDEAKMKAEEEKKKKEEETKKKAEEQKKVIEDEAKMKAEEDKKKLEEDKKKKKKAEEQKKILEDEEKNKLEEENKKKVEDEKKKAEELKKKVEDETKIKAEAEKKKLEEETKKKAEEQKKKLEDEAKMKAEAEKKEQEEETKKKAEEQKKIIEVETKKKAEAEKKKLEEETKKKAEEQKKKLEDEAKMKAEAEKKEQEEETKKKAEEQKKVIEVEAKKKAEAEKKKLEEETKKKAEEQKKKLEDEAKMKADAEKKKQEEETKKKAEEQKKIIEVEAKKKAEAEKKKLEEETKKKAEEQKKKLEYEAKMKAEAEKKKQEEETKKKAEEQKEIIEVEAKMKAEAEKKKQEEETKKKAEEQKEIIEVEAKKKAEAEKKKLEEETKKKAEEQKKKIEDEAKMKVEAERKKQEEETKKKAEEQKKIIEDETKKKAEADKKKQEEDNQKKAEEQKKVVEDEAVKKAEAEKKKLKEENTKVKDEKKKAEELKIKVEDEAKMKAELEVKKQEDETKKKAEEQKNKLEDEAKMKAEAETKKLEEENKKKSEEQEKKHANETKKKSEELEEEKKQLKDDASQKSEVKNKKSRSEKEDDKKKKLKLDSKKKTENDTEVKTKEDEEEARIDEYKSSEKKNLEIEAREKAKLKLELTVNDDEKILEEKGISKKDGELKKKRDDEAVKTLVTEVPEGKMDKEGHGNNLGLISPKDRIDESSFDKRDKYSSFQLAIEEEIDVSKHDVAAERKIRSRSQESAFWVSTTSEPKYKRDDSFAAKSSEVPPRQTWAKREAKCKPYFCGRLMDRTAAQESKVKMSCSFIGNPEPTISWLKDGLPLLHGASDPLAGRCEIKVSNGVATIEIYSASPSDCGRYSCVVSNALGQATTTATLRIFEKFEPTPSPPTFTRRIQDKYDFRADELILECKVQGQPKPAITWRKDDRSLPARGRYQQTEALDGTCRLVISGPEPQDSGVYTCHAENAVWNEQISDVVTFEGRASYAAPAKKETSNRIDYRRPFIANLLGDHNVPAGGTLALHVQLKEKSPGSQISWYRGTEPLSRLSTRAKYFKEDDTYSLVLPEVKPQEAGLYICRVTNAFGHSDTCANVRIISFGSNSQMRGKPAMFTRRPDTTLHIVSGEDVSVSFRLSGDPKPKVTWMKGLKDMTSNARSMKETIDDCTRLTLKRATIYDSGTYFIVAKNIYGCDRAFFTVQVRQRSRSLTPISSYGILDTSTILRDIHEIAQASLQDVPGAISSEPVITDSGRTWLTITWGKPTHRGAAPILAYKVEAWEVGELGGARWSELGVTPMNSFDAFDLRPGSAYRFRITARNRYGWGEPVVTRDPLTVVNCDQIAPEIVSDLPGSLKALINTNLTLQCEVRGEPTPDIRWFRDGKEVAMARHACDRLLVSRKDGICNLMIRDLIPQDSGRYVCEAANKVGRASTFARLLVVHDAKLLKAADLLKRVQEDELTTLESPPQFSLRLRDRRIQVSNPIRLTCQVVGFPAPKITWLKDGTEIKADDHFSFWSEQGFETLEISRSKMEDAGEYTAEARNEHGSVACSCRLVVDKGIKDYIAPGFLAGIEKHAKIREGATLRLRATVEAYPSVDIMWHRDGTRLRQSRRLTCTLDREGHIEFTLAELTCRDAGTYTCTATNEVGRCETVCDVTVTPKLTSPLPSAESVQQTDDGLPYSQVPMFTVKPRSTDALEGDTVILMCEVVGDPEPEIFCLRDGLKPDYYHHGPRFESHREGHRYRLEIPQVRLDFTGAYAIIARNHHGEARAVVSLQIYARGQGKEGTMSSGEVKQGKVQTLPAVRKELKDMRCCDGDSVTLECQVYATPPPDIRWLKDGKILPLGGDISSNVDGEVARLTISKVYPEDEGEYTCMAYNELGRALTSSCLIVDVPEEKETMVTRQLAKPPGFLSTPSTPRTTPSRSISPGVQVTRDFSTPLNRPQRKRTKFSSPKFYAVPHNKVAQEGETVKFQCSAAGHPNPWASWDKDGHIVTPTARLSLLEQDDMRILQIKEVTPEDAGLYRVTLENDYGSVEATARLEVIAHRGTKTKGVRAWSASRASPTFGRRLVGSAARVGDAFTLACDVQASPSPVVTWYRNTEAVVKSDRIKPLWDGRTARLKLKNLEREDAGVYTCVAENELGTTRCSAELIVLSEDDPSDADLRSPVFLVGLPDTTSTPEGQPLELQVKLQGTQPLEVVWSKDEVELPDCMDFRYVDYGDGRFGLRIADAFPADAGHYSCEAFNKHGDAVSYGHLEVTDASDSSDSTKKQLYFTKTPIPLEAEPGQSACFCARVHSPAKTDVHIDWSVASHPTSEQPERFKVERDGDSTVLRIDPVKLEDIGPISCRAHICIEGHTEPSAGCSKCYVTSCTSRLSSVPGAEGWPAQLLHGPADTTALRGQRVILQAAYSGSPQPIVRWLKAGRELSNDGCMTIINEDGLSSLILDPVSADDSGKYVVSVENSHGADCHFASVAVEGPPDPPAGRPSVRTFNSTATIAWSSPPYDGGCMVTGYRVEMKKLPQTSWTVVTDRCHSLSHTVHDLAPGIEYAFRVRAENVHGASEASAETPIISIGAKPSSGSEEDEVCDVKKWERVKVEPGEVFTGRYEIMEELGKGRYGVVHKVVDKKSSQKMAAKFVRCIKKQDKQKVFEEIEIMNCLRHPKLLQLVSAYDNTREIVMVTEYITGGELFERVVADDFTLTERDCMLFMRQICEGVDYMHQNSVVHLDLKPENIMCYTRTSHQIKIIDFGLAQQLSPSIILRVLFGTPEFIPPEIINYEPIGVESDMWSVGVICYVLLSGLSPFMGDNDAETFANITRADFDFDDEAFDAISQDVKDLISNLLVKRKEKRFSARQCLEHKWMSQCDKTMSCVKLSTDKLKKFIIRRKWQKTGNAIRALGRMATLSAASRRNSGTSSQSNSPRQSLAGGGVPRMSSLNEEEQHNHVSTNEEIHQQQYTSATAECNGKNSRVRVCSERSDSGISDCSSINAPTSQQHHSCQPLTDKAFSISEENELCDSSIVESKLTRFHEDTSRTHHDRESKLRFDTSKKHQFKEATKTSFADNLKPSIDEASFKGSLRRKVEVENKRNDSIGSVSFVSTNKRLEDREGLKGIKSPSLTNSPSGNTSVSYLKESSGLPSKKSTNRVSSSPFLNNSFLTDDSSLMKRPDDKCLEHFSDTNAGRTTVQAGGLKVADVRARSVSPALQKDAKVLEKSENFQKAFAFWKR